MSMSNGFGKHFESTYTGSMYGAGPVVFAVWGFVIASTRPPGIVEINPRALAPALGCSVDEINTAITYLCSPDPESRTKEHDGCRLIREGQFMFRVPTFDKYRNARDQDARKAYDRERKRLERERKNDGTCHSMSQNVTHSPPPSAQAEAEAEAEAKGTKTLVETVAPEPKKPRLAEASPTAKLSDDEWLESLAKDETYHGIEVRREHGKMLRWCETHRKQPTRKRFVNWLNRAERPMAGVKAAAPNGSSSAYALKQRLDATETLIREIRNRGIEHPLGWEPEKPEDRVELKRLNTLKKQLTAELSKGTA